MDLFMLTQQPCGRSYCCTHFMDENTAHWLDWPRVPDGSWRNVDSGPSSTCCYMLKHMTSKTHRTHFIIILKKI